MIRSDGAGGKDELRAPFVEQRTYRRRRLMDIARLAPLIGALLFLVPLLWPEGEGSVEDALSASRMAGDTERGGGDGGSSMSSAMIYIFSVWVGLILFSVGFSVAVRRWAVHWTGLSAPLDLEEPPESEVAIVATATTVVGPQDPERGA
ncbi:hypothetical protein [Phaeobacter sp. B1627]|uniref:hypothetical protein n=1 Tax=Phaeobacter sp. B1627 TaxID=2583809 RepID=UPI002104CD32|nr:hypothetical protein [Phaeobacter sp. B1627]